MDVAIAKGTRTRFANGGPPQQSPSTHQCQRKRKAAAQVRCPHIVVRHRIGKRPLPDLSGASLGQLRPRPSLLLFVAPVLHEHKVLHQ